MKSVKNPWLLAPLAAILLAGVAQADTVPKETANEKLVQDFYSALDQPDVAAQIPAIANRFIAEDYIQHSAMGHGNGRAAFIATMNAAQSQGSPTSKLKPLKGKVTMA